MAISCEIKNGVGLVTVTGSLNAAIQESFCNQFGTWLQSQPGAKQVVVDLGAVCFMDSSGLRALITSFKRLAERGGTMNLARPQANVKMVFEITRTNQIFRIFDTIEEALVAAGA